MDERTAAKLKVGTVILFSFLGGLFGALVILLIGLYAWATRLLPFDQLEAEFAQPLVWAFVSLFFVTLIWFLRLYAVERFAERVGGWQGLPRWLRSPAEMEKKESPGKHLKPADKGTPMS